MRMEDDLPRDADVEKLRDAPFNQVASNEMLALLVIELRNINESLAEISYAIRDTIPYEGSDQG